jgi:putative Mg2+ transporter-C (MgtC) family protein
MVVSEYHHYLGSIDPSYMRIDPARIAQGAITGVGFLGAGVILKMGFTIQGLTTAACIWMVSAIGIAVGSGLYLAGVAATAITYLSLWVLRTAERRITKLVFRTLTVLADESLGEEDVSAVIRRHGVSVSGVDYKRDIVGKKVEYRFTITLRQEAAAKRILDELSSLGPVKALTLKA